MSRHCAKPGCNGPADTSLTYDYAASTAWLDNLDDGAHPMAHDLCTAHGDALSVPRGWKLEDRRRVQELYPGSYQQTLAS
jgi:Protein of unknown function (DUF3499)